ncbi:hypothetical protein BpHYR1_019024 [Brachionus plicatilis]|uniref:Uncharacterized protein n=1 Tax=Brachionus plicatilis TaxID=10195 RepID=A0A3M7T4K1_BRAPC|nr:hypothetical protein BpHYR1_019024 [Brachionus plicatilis]
MVKDCFQVVDVEKLINSSWINIAYSSVLFSIGLRSGYLANQGFSLIFLYKILTIFSILF